MQSSAGGAFAMTRHVDLLAQRNIRPADRAALTTETQNLRTHPRLQASAKELLPTRHLQLLMEEILHRLLRSTHLSVTQRCALVEIPPAVHSAAKQDGRRDCRLLHVIFAGHLILQQFPLSLRSQIADTAAKALVFHTAKGPGGETVEVPRSRPACNGRRVPRALLVPNTQIC